MGDKMYAAILNQKLVLAINEAEQVSKGLKKLNQESYLCPSCKHRMILILSEEKKPFLSGKGNRRKGGAFTGKAVVVYCTKSKWNSSRC